ncbi:MAG TPA: hypothetical protein VEI97_14635 [bacterium]|nr:hypothetical protein [bacterium]
MFINGKAGTKSRTLDANIKILVASHVVQVLDPGGASRNADIQHYRAGYGYLFYNSADADGENLVIRNRAGGTIATVNRGEFAIVAANGSAWTLVASGSADRATMTVLTVTTSITLEDDVELYVGTSLDHLISYISASNRTDFVGLDISAGGATAATAALRLDTGNRTKTDTNAGVPGSGAIAIETGTTSVSAAATGGASGALTLASGTTDVTAAGTGGASGAASLKSGNTDSNHASGTGGATGAVTVGSGNAAATSGTSGASGSLTLSTGTSVSSTSGNVSVQTGNVTGGSGNSGSIILLPGTSSGGSRGTVQLDADDVALSVGDDADGLLDYTNGSHLVRLRSAAVTGGGAGAASAALTVTSGARTKNDTNAGVPTSGAITLASGATDVTAAATGGSSGALTVQSGATDSNHAGGTGGASGAVTVQSGNASSTLGTSGASGSVTIKSGNSDDGNSGNVVLETGSAGGTKGIIDINAAIDNDVALSAAGSAADIALTFNHATGVGVGLSVSAAQVTTNRTAGTLSAIKGSITSLSGDTAGVDYYAFEAAVTVGAAGADHFVLKQGAGFDQTLDASAAATTEAGVVVGAALADAWHWKTSAVTYVVLRTTTATPGIDETFTLTATGDAHNIAATVNSATGVVQALDVSITTATTNHTSGNISAVRAAVTSLAGDTGGVFACVELASTDGGGTTPTHAGFLCASPLDALLYVDASGSGSVVVGAMTAKNPESDTEAGYFSIRVGATRYEVPMYAVA